MKRKVCVVVTARPSYSRIKTALEAIKAHGDLELQLVVAASSLLDKYGKVVKQIEKDGFEITARVYNLIEGETLLASAKTTGLGILELSSVFENIAPDVVVTIADRYETMSTAIAASYMNIPLVHIQGGEVTGNIDEKVRHAITKLSDFHFVATQKSKERVVKMGEREDRVYVTGCPSIDIAAEIINNKTLDFDPVEKYGGVGDVVANSEGHIVVMQHPVTSEQSLAKQQVLMTLDAVSKFKNIQVYWFWPNVDAGSDGTSKGIRGYREKGLTNNIWYFKNLSPNDFLKLVYSSRAIVGNSSVAIRECSFLGVPAINIGTRQSGRERGTNVIDVGYNSDKIYEAIHNQINSDKIMKSSIYGSGNGGEIIADYLAAIELSFTKMLTY